MVRLRSVCPYDCPDTCGLLVEVEGGRAVRVQGDPEHPSTRGTLCPKMTRYQDTVHHPDRLRTPLRRVGAKGEGRFEPMGWEEALDEVEAGFRAIIARHGAQAILPYSYGGTMGLVQRNAGHAFFHSLGASRLDRTICASAKGAGMSAVLGKTPGADPDEVQACDLIVIWGANLVATSVHGLAPIREARKRGARVWLVDTYHQATAAHVDEVVTVKPGTDGALALGLMHLLVAADHLDHAFLAAHVMGFEALRDQVLPDFPPARVAALTGVPEETLRRLAEAYGRARASHIRIGGGVTRYGNGAMTTRLIAILPALTGACLAPGGGVSSGLSTGAAVELGFFTAEHRQPGPTRLVNMNRLGEALLEVQDPPVMGLYVYHANPALVAPGQVAVRQGLAREDLFTVVHERFLTDTARYADVVLPATSSLEHADLYRSYGHYQLQAAWPVVEPVGEARSNWAVFRELARRFGFEGEPFDLDAEAVIRRLVDQSSPWRPREDRQDLLEGRPVTLVPPRTAPPFLTPSGRVEILNPLEPDPLPRWFPPHSAEDPEPLALVTAPGLFGLNGSFHERLDRRADRDGRRLKMALSDAQARGLVDGQPVEAFNAFGRAPFLLEVTDQVPAGSVVVEGLAWTTDGRAGFNSLTSQRLSDRGGGSTFGDHRVEVAPLAGGAPGL